MRAVKNVSREDVFPAPDAVCRPFSFLTEFHVETQGVCPERAAIVIIGWVHDMLGVQSGEESFHDVSVVIAFPNVFWHVVQPSVADQEIETAALEIERMDGRQTARCEFAGNRVFRAFPERARNGDSAGGET